MNKPKSVLENETDKIPLDFEIQRDHLISTIKSDLAMIEQKKIQNLPYCGLCRPGRVLIENHRKRKERQVSRSLPEN